MGIGADFAHGGVELVAVAVEGEWAVGVREESGVSYCFQSFEDICLELDLLYF